MHCQVERHAQQAGWKVGNLPETHFLWKPFVFELMPDTNNVTLFIGSSPNLSLLRHHLRGCRAKIPFLEPRPRLPHPFLLQRSKRNKTSLTLLHIAQSPFSCKKFSFVDLALTREAGSFFSLCLRCSGHGWSWLSIRLTLMMDLCQWIEGNQAQDS